MQVFIENEAGSKQKNIYNEKTLEFIKTIQVAQAYPFPYGFVLNTLAEDGDNIDVFVLTQQKLVSGQIVECQAIALMEQFEMSWDKEQSHKEEIDHYVIALLIGDAPITLNDRVQAQLTNFVRHVFDNIQINKTRIGDFLPKENAIQYIQSHQL